jgi:hypothetical protein
VAGGIKTEYFFQDLHSLFYLENPLDSGAGTDPEAFGGTEIIGEFDLSADVQVIDAEMAAYVIPELRLGEKYGMGCLGSDDSGVVGKEHMVLPPEIRKTGETQPLGAEEILQAPDESELKRNLLGGVGYALVERLDIEGIPEVLAVQEVIQSGQEGVVDLITPVNASVILHLQAEGSDGAVAPEIQATGNLQIGAAGSIYLVVVVSGVEVVVEEEEGIAPIVVVEALESRRYVLTVRPEIVLYLKVCLRLHRCREGGNESCDKKNSEVKFHLFLMDSVAND